MTVLKLFDAYLVGTSQATIHQTSISPHSPEHAVTNLINLPCSNERDIARNSRFQHVSLPIDYFMLLLYTRNLHPGRHAALVVPHRNGTFLHGRRRAGWREEGRNACCVCAYTLSECALGNEFKGDLALEVCLFELLVSIVISSANAT